MNDALGAPDLFGHVPTPNAGGGALAQTFIIPPFTVLNAREGWWQERKRAWLARFGRAHKSAMPEGRGDNLIRGTNYTAEYMEDAKERFATGFGYVTTNDTTSVLDPVLMELALRWFCPPGGKVLDPFAGDVESGLVSAVLGYEYRGHELRPEQCAANTAAAAALGTVAHVPVWVEGDSGQTLDPDHLASYAQHYDMVWTCPPYGDLEQYSDLPADLSNMTYDEFRKALARVFTLAADCLKPDRFMVCCVGDFRDKRGIYRCFPWHTIEAAQAAGLQHYNEAVLVTSVGSLPIRTGKQFAAGRKLGKTHQNVFVFVKGDPKRAAKACGATPVDEVNDLAEYVDKADAPPELETT